MRQASGGYDRTNLRQERFLKFRLALQDSFGNIVAQGTADAGDFETMREPVVYKDAARQRKYLRLIL
ncbi:hypothetical protein JCM10556A_22000 [Bacteroides acidifaciens]